MTPEEAQALGYLYAKHHMVEAGHAPEKNDHREDYSTQWPNLELPYDAEMAFFDEAEKLLGG